jgi:hypothetical protein
MKTDFNDGTNPIIITDRNELRLMFQRLILSVLERPQDYFVEESSTSADNFYIGENYRRDLEDSERKQPKENKFEKFYEKE